MLISNWNTNESNQNVEDTINFTINIFKLCVVVNNHNGSVGKSNEGNTKG